MPGCSRCLGLSGLALAGLVGVLLSRDAAAGLEPTPQQAEFFEKKIRPLLESNCFQCHSHKAGKSKGKLMVDSLGSLLKGGESGPALVPGQPDKSLLVKAIGYQDDELRMPPKGKLPVENIAWLRQWIQLGAPWPGSPSEKSLRTPGKITDEDRKWWAFQPVRVPALPEVADPAWAANPVDRFIRHRLDAEGLKPSPPADRAALIRRVTFDLIGLPPTPEEVAAFVRDPVPDAYEKLVDRLLASPRYAERWARHWLDLVRYAESDGFRQDAYRPQAWRYRDYVVKAFHTDKPYNQFVCEQLAGDEIAPDDPGALVATGYLRHTMYEFNQRDARTQWQNTLDDVTDVTADVFLGMGLGCARCHDHKFDPLLQKDYYRLQAFFAGMFPRDLPLAGAKEMAEHREKQQRWEELTAPIRAKLQAFEAAERKKAEDDAIFKFPPDIQAMLRKAEAERSPLEKQLATLAYRQIQLEFDTLDTRFKAEQKKKHQELLKELAQFGAHKPAPLPVGMTMANVGPEAPPTRIPKKTTSPDLEPGFLTVLGDTNSASTPPHAGPGRRRALADWLTRPDHPLTTRVIVNRIWQHHFGRGLVPTPSDFGKLGEPPSHPELLDFLTSVFISPSPAEGIGGKAAPAREEGGPAAPSPLGGEGGVRGMGWSIKKMHRLLLTSQTYRQAATSPAAEAALKKDPENRLLWKMNTRRLDAEQIRDAILAVTGKLDLTAGGPGVLPTEPRRSIYTKALRNTRDPLLDVFDAPEGFSSMPQRNVTTTATQALLLFNSPFMLQQAKNFADRVLAEKTADPIGRAYRLALGRAPSQEEFAQAKAFLQVQGRRGGATGERAAFVDFCHVLLNANEFLYVD